MAGPAGLDRDRAEPKPGSSGANVTAMQDPETPAARDARRLTRGARLRYADIGLVVAATSCATSATALTGGIDRAEPNPSRHRLLFTTRSTGAPVYREFPGFRPCSRRPRFPGLCARFPGVTADGRGRLPFRRWPWRS